MHNLLKNSHKYYDNTYKCYETTEELPSDLPQYSSLFASSIEIHQNFNLQNFPMYGIIIGVKDYRHEI